MSDEWRQTICILCSVNCGIEVKLEDRHIARVRGNRAHVASHGYACEKAQRLDYYQNGRDRLTSPLRRRADGSFEEIDWDTAIREVAAGFLRVRDRWGGASIFYYGGGGQGNHLCGAYGAATRRALGRSLAPTPWPRKRPASSGWKPCCSGRASPPTSSRRKSRYSSARIHGNRTAFSARGRSCAKSPPTRIARSS